MKTLRERLSAGIYAATDRFARAVLFTLGRWEVRGVEHIPKTGPVILVGNHVHLLDPPLVGACELPRGRLAPLEDPSEAYVLSRDVALLEPLLGLGWTLADDASFPEVTPWTDDYANVLAPLWARLSAR